MTMATGTNPGDEAKLALPPASSQMEEVAQGQPSPPSYSQEQFTLVV